MMEGSGIWTKGIIDAQALSLSLRDFENPMRKGKRSRRGGGEGPSDHLECRAASRTEYETQYIKNLGKINEWQIL